MGGPSNILIEMANEDHERKTRKASNFVNRKLLHYREATKTLNLEALKLFCSGNHQRERESIADLTAFVLRKKWIMMSLVDEVEGGAADAYFHSEEDTFVGCQVTRGTISSSLMKHGNCTIAKSKEEIVEYVNVKGFALFMMLYVDDTWRGVAFLTPDDKELIEALPNFKKYSFGVHLGKGGVRRRIKFKSGSVSETLFNAKRLFLWPDGRSPTAHWFRNVQVFLDKQGNKKYSLEQLKLMLSRNHHIEYMYSEAFRALFPDAKRMERHQFGDIVFTVQTFKIEAEFKFASLRHSPKAGCYICRCQ